MNELAIDLGFKYPDVPGRPGFAMNFAGQFGGRTLLCGPSGCGKTTLLRLIAGLLRPTRGHIRLGDHVLFDAAARINLPPERRGVGIVFQDDRLFGHMSVRDNLLYGARRRRGAPRQPPGVELARVVETLDLVAHLAARPLQLSGGQRQRVAIGRALLMQPRLLLLDEPFAGLDPPLRQQVSAYLAAVLCEAKVTTILVTHDAEPAAALVEATVKLPRQAYPAPQAPATTMLAASL